MNLIIHSKNTRPQTSPSTERDDSTGVRMKDGFIEEALTKAPSNQRA